MAGQRGTDAAVGRAARGFGLLALLLVLRLPAHAANPDIVITIRNHAFVPTDVPVPAGQKLKLIIKNEGATTSEFESVDFHREKIVQAGREITVFVGPLSPGRYEFFDDFHPETRGRLIAH